jgi:hypothetical protein
LLSPAIIDVVVAINALGPEIEKHIQQFAAHQFYRICHVAARQAFLICKLLSNRRAALQWEKKI